MSDDRLNELMYEAKQLPYSPLKVELLEEATREADSHGTPADAWEARDQLVRAASMSGIPEKALVAFTWMLAVYDDAPDEIRGWKLHVLLWQYKWIAQSVVNFPQISREQVMNILDDMEVRFKRAGFSLRPVHWLRGSNLQRMGNREEALPHFKRWKAASRDSMADCAACECGRRCDIHLYHNDKKALKELQPILDGKHRCLSVPKATYSTVIPIFVRLGDWDQAEHYHKKGYRLIANDLNYLDCVAENLVYLTRTGNLSRGLRIFERHYALARQCTDLDDRFFFELTAWLLLEAINNRPRRKPTLKLPAALEEELGAEECTLPALQARLERDVADLARRFNERNGNDHYSLHIARHREMALGS